MITPQDLLDGKRVAFVGGFAYWPSYHDGTPEHVAVQHGAILTDDVNEHLQVIVFGDKRGRGKSEVKKKVKRLKQLEEKRGLRVGEGLDVMDEAMFRELVKFDVTGKRFSFCGGFDCCPKEMSDLLRQMVEAAGAHFHETVDAEADYLIVGNRRGKGKTAALRTAELLNEAEPTIAIVGEEGFLELVRTEVSKNTEDVDGDVPFAAFFSGIHGLADEKKIQRAVKMLQKETFQLYSSIKPDSVCGIVRSQSNPDSIYAPWLSSSGRYGCSTLDMADCMGLQGRVCKHLLVLLLGLVRAKELSAKETLQWLSLACNKSPKKEGDPAVDAFLQYKGVIAGELDWRPTETLPEDFVAF